MDDGETLSDIFKLK